jgi:hypothetical protein
MEDLDRNIKTLYRNIPPLSSTDIPVRLEMLERVRQLSKTPGVEPRITPVPQLARLETNTMGSAVMHEYFKSGALEPSGQIVFHQTEMPFGAVPRIVPAVEIMLRGETRQYGPTELAVCRFTLQGDDHMSRDLYTQMTGEVEDPQEDEDEVDATFRSVTAFIDRVPLSYVELLRGLQFP